MCQSQLVTDWKISIWDYIALLPGQWRSMDYTALAWFPGNLCVPKYDIWLAKVNLAAFMLRSHSSRVIDISINKQFWTSTWYRIVVLLLYSALIPSAQFPEVLCSTSFPRKHTTNRGGALRNKIDHHWPSYQVMRCLKQWRLRRIEIDHQLFIRQMFKHEKTCFVWYATSWVVGAWHEFLGIPRKSRAQKSMAACSHTLLVRGFRLVPRNIYDTELNDMYAWRCHT